MGILDDYPEKPKNGWDDQVGDFRKQHSRLPYGMTDNDLPGAGTYMQIDRGAYQLIGLRCDLWQKLSLDLLEKQARIIQQIGEGMPADEAQRKLQAVQLEAMTAIKAIPRG